MSLLRFSSPLRAPTGRHFGAGQSAEKTPPPSPNPPRGRMAAGMDFGTVPTMFPTMFPTGRESRARHLPPDWRTSVSGGILFVLSPLAVGLRPSLRRGPRTRSDGRSACMGAIRTCHPATGVRPVWGRSGSVGVDTSGIQGASPSEPMRGPVRSVAGASPRQREDIEQRSCGPP